LETNECRKGASWFPVLRYWLHGHLAGWQDANVDAKQPLPDHAVFSQIKDNVRKIAHIGGLDLKNACSVIVHIHRKDNQSS